MFESAQLARRTFLTEASTGVGMAALSTLLAREARSAWGVEVWPDIQNPLESPEQWSKAMALGFQGLQSDHPAQLIAYLKSIGKR